MLIYVLRVGLFCDACQGEAHGVVPEVGSLHQLPIIISKELLLIVPTAVLTFPVRGDKSTKSFLVSTEKV